MKRGSLIKFAALFCLVAGQASYSATVSVTGKVITVRVFGNEDIQGSIHAAKVFITLDTSFESPCTASNFVIPGPGAGAAHATDDQVYWALLQTAQLAYALGSEVKIYFSDDAGYCWNGRPIISSILLQPIEP